MRTAVALGLVLAACVLAGNGATGTLRQAAHSPRFLVAQKLARGITALCRQQTGVCPLQGQAFVIEDVGYREHLSPAFMVGASWTESSGGASPCCGQPWNIWGYYAMPQVSNWRDAFTVYARFIHHTWPSATTAWQLYGYCPPCGAVGWGNATSRWMARMGFGGGKLAYP